MKPRFYSPVIFVTDIEQSKTFYCDQLGQTIQHDFGKNVELQGGLTLWELRSDHVIPEKLGGGITNPQAANRFELYFEFDDINAIFGKLKTAGVEFLHEIHEEPWGQRTIRFFDPDRHLIEVGETLACFVNRLYQSYGTVEAVSGKTGIPMSTVQELVEK